MDVIEDIYAELAAAGKNDVEHLVQWMRDAKVIGGTRYADARARQLFREAGEDKEITFDKFQERIMVRVANDANATLEELNHKLSSAAIRDRMQKLLR